MQKIKATLALAHINGGFAILSPTNEEQIATLIESPGFVGWLSPHMELEVHPEAKDSTDPKYLRDVQSQMANFILQDIAVLVISRKLRNFDREVSHVAMIRKDSSESYIKSMVEEHAEKLANQYPEFRDARFTYAVHDESCK